MTCMMDNQRQTDRQTDAKTNMVHLDGMGSLTLVKVWTES